MPDDLEDVMVENEPQPFVWTRRGGGSTVTLKLDEEGRLKPLSDKLQSRLREFAARDDWKEATGLSAERAETSTPRAAIQLVDEDKAKEILKGLESVKRVMWSLIGLSEAKRTEIIRYSEAQRDLLAPPISKVINKRAPDWMRKYWDEVQLALFMGTIEIGQFQLCARALVEERKAAQRKPAVVRPIQEREPRTEVRETIASAEARAEVQENFVGCDSPGCTEPAVPGMHFCRKHRSAVEQVEA